MRMSTKVTRKKNVAIAFISVNSIRIQLVVEHKK